MTTCPSCGRTERTGSLCTTCTRRLQRDLQSVPELLTELDVTMAKQSRIKAQADERSKADLAHERTPINTSAAAATFDLVATLTVWSARLGHPHRYATTAAATLLAHLNDIRARGDAAQAHADITTAVSAGRRTIDTPAGRAITVGQCPQCDDGIIRAWLPTDDTRPATLQCDTDPAHTWDSTQWYRLGQRLLRTGAA